MNDNIDLQELLHSLYNTSESWHNDLIKTYEEERHINDLISAARFYGQMSAAAFISKALGGHELEARLKRQKQKYPEDFQQRTGGIMDYINAMFQEDEHWENFHSLKYDESRNVDDLITAAQFYGKMCALASLAAHMMNKPDLLQKIQGEDYKLFPSQFDADGLPWS